MRISRVNIELSADDVNSLIEEFAPDAPIRITHITRDGLYGQLKLLLWSVDFTAKVWCGGENDGSTVGADGRGVPDAEGSVPSTVFVDVSAHKLVAIPSMIVERQLREAVKDAPDGIDVIRTTLRVHLPSLLIPLGVTMAMEALETADGALRIGMRQLALPGLAGMMGMRDEM